MYFFTLTIDTLRYTLAHCTRSNRFIDYTFGQHSSKHGSNFDKKKNKIKNLNYFYDYLFIILFQIITIINKQKEYK